MMHIVTFEWLRLRKSVLFWMMVVVLPVLTGYSIYLGHAQVQSQITTIEALQSAESEFYREMQQRLEAVERGDEEFEMWWQNPANPLVLAQFNQAGRHVFLEPKPLAVLARGQLDILPYYGKVTLTQVQPLRDNALENPFMQVVGTFDFAFVLVWLVPLFVIILGYNVLSSERELGTYALLRTNPVSMGRILFYKLLIRFALVFGILAISLLMWSKLFGITMFHADGFALFAAMGLYLAFWLLLCAVVNLGNTGSAVNAVGLAGLWVLFLLLIPAVISLLAASLHPVPSRALWITDQRAIQQAVETERENLFDTWRAEHPEEVVEGDTPFFYEVWLQRFVTAETVRSRESEARRQFEEPKINQAAFVARLRPLSPPMWLQSWLEKKAGTDAMRLKSLEAELYNFQQEWINFFIPRFRQLDFFSSEELAYIPMPVHARPGPQVPLPDHPSILPDQ